MHNLLHAHNRRYYRQKYRVLAGMYWKLLRLGLAGDLILLGCWISPELKKEIESRLQRRDDWYDA